MALRASNSIKLENARNLMAAVNFADVSGLKLNTTVNIHWSLVDGCSDPRKRQAGLIEKARHWLNHRKIPLTCVWVLEHATGKKLHSHMALHVPKGRGAEFKRQLVRWVGPSFPKALDVGRVNDRGWFNYMIKDVEPAFYGQLGIHPANRKGRSIQPIVGKRVGVSQNIGQAARDRWAAANSTKLEDSFLS